MNSRLFSRSASVRAVCAAGVAAILGQAASSAPPSVDPAYHDWLVRWLTVPADSSIIPIPHPGHDWGVWWPGYWTLWEQMMAEGKPVGFMLRNSTAPIGGTNPTVLETLLDNLPKIDLIYADFENATYLLDEYWMVFLTRTHWNPDVADAWIGSYRAYPGPYDASQLTPNAAIRSFESQYYLQSGMDIAMPNSYPYDDFQVHTWPNVWGTNICPSVRYALLWAPVHRISVAKQSLPPSHRLVPWLATFVQTNNYGPVDPPPKEDNVAVLQHMRLRGIDGYYTLTSFTPGYSAYDYMMDMRSAWKALDPWFSQGPIQVLNHGTDKTGGILWSGVQTPQGTVVLVSNFSGQEITFTLPGGPWPGDGTVTVPHEAHVLVTPPTDEEEEDPGDPVDPKPTPDLNGDGIVNAADIGILLAAWGPCPSQPQTCPADLNGDGVVNASDLGIVLGQWGPFGG